MAKIERYGCMMTTAPDAYNGGFVARTVEDTYHVLKARGTIVLGGVQTLLKDVELRTLADGTQELWITWESDNEMIFPGYTGFSVEEKREE